MLVHLPILRDMHMCPKIKMSGSRTVPQHFCQFYFLFTVVCSKVLAIPHVMGFFRHCEMPPNVGVHRLVGMFCGVSLRSLEVDTLTDH